MTVSESLHHRSLLQRAVLEWARVPVAPKLAWWLIVLYLDQFTMVQANKQVEACCAMQAASHPALLPKGVIKCYHPVSTADACCSAIFACMFMVLADWAAAVPLRSLCT